jgi:hypothetical protein
MGKRKFNLFQQGFPTLFFIFIPYDTEIERHEVFSIASPWLIKAYEGLWAKVGQSIGCS